MSGTERHNEPEHPEVAAEELSAATAVDGSEAVAECMGAPTAEGQDAGSASEEQGSAAAGITVPVSAAAVSGVATVAASSKAAAAYRQTADEHVKTLKDFWKDFLVSGIFILAAIVIIFACLAWFAANNRVSATGSGISAKGPRFVMMADVKDGQDSHAGVYDDRMTKEDGDELSFAVTDESNLNNYTQEGLYPGASGVLSFTVTPYADNLHDITISLSRVIATKNNVDGDAALGLFKGHLLFFEQKTGDYYSGRVKDDAFTIKKERFYKGETTKTEKPVHITLYWVWPEYFQNYVLTGSTGYYKNLFASTDDTDYSSLQENMNKYPERYFEGTVGGETKVKVGSEMSSSAMTIGSALFNNADEKLGNEVDYLKINLKAKEAAQEGTTSGSN